MGGGGPGGGLFGGEGGARVGGSRRGAPLPPPPLTEAGLAALYNDCNRTRFGGRLPRAVVEWHQPPPGMMASTHPNSALGPSIWIHPLFAAVSGKRSEEHTSELQSRLHLVCRLLLEKKKRYTRKRR